MNVTLEGKTPLTVPLMPLDGHVLLPASATPYRVSDWGHCALVSDLMERPLGERWVAVPPRDQSGPRPRDEIAALGLITIATPLDSGEFIVVVEGKGACHLESVETPSHTPYAVARVRHLADRPEPIARAADATTGLIQALFSLYESYGLGAMELPHHEQPLDDSALVYRVGNAVIEDPSARSRLLAERCPARRRALVLEQIVDQMAFATREGLLGRQSARC